MDDYTQAKLVFQKNWKRRKLFASHVWTWFKLVEFLSR